MAKIATGYVALKVETEKLRKEMEQVKQTIRDAASDCEKRMKTATDNMSGAWDKFAKGAVAAGGAILAAKGIQSLATQFLDAAATAETYETRLKILLRSQEEGNRMFKEMAKYASQVPFEYRDIMEAATALSGVMKGGVDEVKRWIPMIGDLAAASGLSIGEATSQVIRMYSAGAASADLFRERGILSMLGFQAGVTYSAEETRAQLIAAWSDVDSKFRGATAEMADDWTGKVSMLSDAWFKFSEGFGRIILSKMKPEVDLLTQAVSWLGDKIQEVADNVELSDEANRWDQAISKSTGSFGKMKDAVIAWGEKQVEWFKAASKASNEFLYEEEHRHNAMMEHLKEQRALGLFLYTDTGSPADSERKKRMEKEAAAWNLYADPGKDWDLPDRNLKKKQTDSANAKNEAEKGYYEWLELKQRKTDMEVFMEQDLQDKLAEMRETKIEREAGDLAARQAQLSAHHDEAIALLLWRSERELEIEEQLKKSKDALAKRSAASQFQIATSLASALLSVAGASSKQIFAVTKALEFGQAIMAAHAAYNLALANPPGPPWTIPIAEAARAAGYLNAAAIAATALGQMAMSSNGNVGRGTYTSPVVTTAGGGLTDVPVTGEQKGQVNIYLEGDLLADQYYIELLAEKLSEAVEDKEVRLISSKSKY
jgi:hypothetical protein